MGLDMYLYCNSKKVCQEVNDMHDDWEGGYQATHGIAIYWRKANAVHKWFVDNVQGGEDDCGTYEVSVDQLARLHDICKEIIDNSKLVDGDIVNGYTFEDGERIPIMEKGQYIEDTKLAEELLPTQEGFFFGGTAYDQYYWWDIQYTMQKLEKLLDCLEPGKRPWETVHKDEPDWCVKFEYHSSW